MLRDREGEAIARTLAELRENVGAISPYGKGALQDTEEWAPVRDGYADALAGAIVCMLQDKLGGPVLHRARRMDVAVILVSIQDHVPSMHKHYVAVSGRPYADERVRTYQKALTAAIAAILLGLVEA